MEAIIRRYLKTYFSAFLEKYELSVSIGGTMVLKNVELRASILTELGVPLRLGRFTVQSIVAKVPMPGQARHPAHVHIDGVHVVLLALPTKAAVALTHRDIQSAAQDLRQELAAGLFKLLGGGTSPQRTKFMASQAKKVLSHMRVSITRVHIQYMHQVGDEVHMGLVLPHARLSSATEDWQPVVRDEDRDTLMAEQVQTASPASGRKGFLMQVHQMALYCSGVHRRGLAAAPAAHTRRPSHHQHHPIHRQRDGSASFSEASPPLSQRGATVSTASAATPTPIRSSSFDMDAKVKPPLTRWGSPHIPPPKQAAVGPATTLRQSVPEVVTPHALHALPSTLLSSLFVKRKAWEDRGAVSVPPPELWPAWGITTNHDLLPHPFCLAPLSFAVRVTSRVEPPPPLPVTPIAAREGLLPGPPKLSVAVDIPTVLLSADGSQVAGITAAAAHGTKIWQARKAAGVAQEYVPTTSGPPPELAPIPQRDLHSACHQWITSLPQAATKWQRQRRRGQLAMALYVPLYLRRLAATHKLASRLTQLFGREIPANVAHILCMLQPTQVATAVHSKTESSMLAGNKAVAAAGERVGEDGEDSFRDDAEEPTADGRTPRHLATTRTSALAYIFTPLLPGLGRSLATSSDHASAVAVAKWLQRGLSKHELLLARALAAHPCTTTFILRAAHNMAAAWCCCVHVSAGLGHYPAARLPSPVRVGLQILVEGFEWNVFREQEGRANQKQRLALATEQPLLPWAHDTGGSAGVSAVLCSAWNRRLGFEADHQLPIEKVGSVEEALTEALTAMDSIAVARGPWLASTTHITWNALPLEDVPHLEPWCGGVDVRTVITLEQLVLVLRQATTSVLPSSKPTSQPSRAHHPSVLAHVTGLGSTGYLSGSTIMDDYFQDSGVAGEAVPAVPPKHPTRPSSRSSSVGTDQDTRPPLVVLVVEGIEAEAKLSHAGQLQAAIDVKDCSLYRVTKVPKRSPSTSDTSALISLAYGILPPYRLCLETPLVERLVGSVPEPDRSESFSSGVSPFSSPSLEHLSPSSQPLVSFRMKVQKQALLLHQESPPPALTVLGDHFRHLPTAAVSARMDMAPVCLHWHAPTVALACLQAFWLAPGDISALARHGVSAFLDCIQWTVDRLTYSPHLGIFSALSPNSLLHTSPLLPAQPLKVEGSTHCKQLRLVLQADAQDAPTLAFDLTGLTAVGLFAAVSDKAKILSSSPLFEVSDLPLGNSEATLDELPPTCDALALVLKAQERRCHAELSAAVAYVHVDYLTAQVHDSGLSVPATLATADDVTIDVTQLQSSSSESLSTAFVTLKVEQATAFMTPETVVMACTAASQLLVESITSIVEAVLAASEKEQGSADVSNLGNISSSKHFRAAVTEARNAVSRMAEALDQQISHPRSAARKGVFAILHGRQSLAATSLTTAIPPALLDASLRLLQHLRLATSPALPASLWALHVKSAEVRCSVPGTGKCAYLHGMMDSLVACISLADHVFAASICSRQALADFSVGGLQDMSDLCPAQVGVRASAGWQAQIAIPVPVLLCPARHFADAMAAATSALGEHDAQPCGPIWRLIAAASVTHASLHTWRLPVTSDGGQWQAPQLSAMSTIMPSTSMNVVTMLSHSVSHSAASKPVAGKPLLPQGGNLATTGQLLRHALNHMGNRWSAAWFDAIASSAKTPLPADAAQKSFHQQVFIHSSSTIDVKLSPVVITVSPHDALRSAIVMASIGSATESVIGSAVKAIIVDGLKHAVSQLGRWPHHDDTIFSPSEDADASQSSQLWPRDVLNVLQHRKWAASMFIDCPDIGVTLAANSAPGTVKPNLLRFTIKGLFAAAHHGCVSPTHTADQDSPLVQVYAAASLQAVLDGGTQWIDVMSPWPFVFSLVDASRKQAAMVEASLTSPSPCRIAISPPVLARSVVALDSVIALSKRLLPALLSSRHAFTLDSLNQTVSMAEDPSPSKSMDGSANGQQSGELGSSHYIKNNTGCELRYWHPSRRQPDAHFTHLVPSGVSVRERTVALNLSHEDNKTQSGNCCGKSTVGALALGSRIAEVGEGNLEWRDKVSIAVEGCGRRSSLNIKANRQLMRLGTKGRTTWVEWASEQFADSTVVTCSSLLSIFNHAGTHVSVELSHDFLSDLARSHGTDTISVEVPPGQQVYLPALLHRQTFSMRLGVKGVHCAGVSVESLGEIPTLLEFASGGFLVWLTKARTQHSQSIHVASPMLLHNMTPTSLCVETVAASTIEEEDGIKDQEVSVHGEFLSFINAPVPFELTGGDAVAVWSGSCRSSVGNSSAYWRIKICSIASCWMPLRPACSDAEEMRVPSCSGGELRFKPFLKRHAVLALEKLAGSPTLTSFEVVLSRCGAGPTSPLAWSLQVPVWLVNTLDVPLLAAPLSHYLSKPSVDVPVGAGLHHPFPESSVTLMSAGTQGVLTCPLTAGRLSCSVDAHYISCSNRHSLIHNEKGIAQGWFHHSSYDNIEGSSSPGWFSQRIFGSPRTPGRSAHDAMAIEWGDPGGPLSLALFVGSLEEGVGLVLPPLSRKTMESKLFYCTLIAEKGVYDVVLRWNHLLHMDLIAPSLFSATPLGSGLKAIPAQVFDDDSNFGWQSTRVLTVSPLFILVNESPFSVYFAQAGSHPDITGVGVSKEDLARSDASTFVIFPGKSHPLRWCNGSAARLGLFAFAAPDSGKLLTGWSCPVSPPSLLANVSSIRVPCLTRLCFLSVRLLCRPLGTFGSIGVHISVDGAVPCRPMRDPSGERMNILAQLEKFARSGAPLTGDAASQALLKSLLAIGLQRGACILRIDNDTDDLMYAHQLTISSGGWSPFCSPAPVTLTAPAVESEALLCSDWDLLNANVASNNALKFLYPSQRWSGRGAEREERRRSRKFGKQRTLDNPTLVLPAAPPLWYKASLAAAKAGDSSAPPQALLLQPAVIPPRSSLAFPLPCAPPAGTSLILVTPVAGAGSLAESSGPWHGSVVVDSSDMRSHGSVLVGASGLELSGELSATKQRGKGSALVYGQAILLHGTYSGRAWGPALPSGEVAGVPLDAASLAPFFSKFAGAVQSRLPSHELADFCRLNSRGPSGRVIAAAFRGTSAFASAPSPKLPLSSQWRSHWGRCRRWPCVGHSFRALSVEFVWLLGSVGRKGVEDGQAVCFGDAVLVRGIADGATLWLRAGPQGSVDWDHGPGSLRQEAAVAATAMSNRDGGVRLSTSSAEAAKFIFVVVGGTHGKALSSGEAFALAPAAYPCRVLECQSHPPDASSKMGEGSPLLPSLTVPVVQIQCDSSLLRHCALSPGEQLGPPKLPISGTPVSDHGGVKLPSWLLADSTADIFSIAFIEAPRCDRTNCA